LIAAWWVSKDAPKGTLAFMKVWLGKEIQSKLAAEGLSIPMVKGTADAIENPFYKALAGGRCAQSIATTPRSFEAQ